MKNNLLCVLVLLAFTLSNPIWGIDKATLRNKFNHPSFNSFQEREAAARQNIGMIEEIVFFSDMVDDNSCARENILALLRYYAEGGTIYTKEKYFDILLRLYNQVTTVVHPIHLEDTKNLIKGQLSSFGLVSSKSPLSFSFSAFPALTNSMMAAGFIKNQGLQNSLTQKVANAKETMEKRGPDSKNTAVNKVQAALNELDAQRGKGISEDGYQILSACCKNLITKIQSSNP